MVKNNLILDLDETLIHTQNILNLKNIECDVCNIIKLPNFIGIVYLRKYLKEFLSYCYDNFYVSFWTASNSLYCKEILKLILEKDQYDDTLLILISEENKIINLKTNIIYENNTINPKPLSLLWNDPILSQLFNENNTLLIDNDKSITEYNKYNSIMIDSFYNNDNYDVFCKMAIFIDILKDSDRIQEEDKNYSISKNCCNLLLSRNKNVSI